MKKTLMTLLVAGVALWTRPASAENIGDSRRAVPDSAIEEGNSVWSPSPSVVYTRRGKWIVPASSTSGGYVSANIGDAEIDNVDYFDSYNDFRHSHSGFAMLGAVGYGFKNNVRLEGEVGYQTDDSNNEYRINANRNISVLSFLANGYYDIPVFGAVQPYVTAGIGLANVNANSLSLPYGLPDLPSINETALAYQVGFGVTIPLNKSIKLDARYRYFTTNVTVDTVFEKNRLYSNSVLLGIKVGI
ncbi:MAG: porin family protein [Chlorobium sp.]|nr:MAG: porin family protein [Chlorobium sp.]